ncbi:hypothetical protein DIPPA_10893 [Diplonema papillatum]|nr:hypothetical protein DIPPA_10893 [Diplonema papillatum]
MRDHATSVCFEPAEDEAAVRRVLAGAGCLEGLAEVHLLQGHARLRYETEGQALQAAALLPWDAAAAAGTMPGREDEAAVRRMLAGAGCLEGLAEVHLLQGHARLRYETEGQALQAAALLPWDAAAAAGTMPAVPGVPKGAVPSFLQKMQQAANPHVAAVNRQNTARAPALGRG